MNPIDKAVDLLFPMGFRACHSEIHDDHIMIYVLDDDGDERAYRWSHGKLVREYAR